MFEPRFEIEQAEYDRMRSDLDRLRARVAELEAALEAQSEALRDEGARSRAYEQEAYDNWCAAQEDR